MLVSLPTTTAVPKAPSKADVELVAGNGESVLVVEDDPAVRELVEEMLATAGYVVVSAATPGEAIAIAEGDETIDAIVRTS